MIFVAMDSEIKCDTKEAKKIGNYSLSQAQAEWNIACKTAINRWFCN